MNTSKRIMIAAALVLFAGLFANAVAQVQIGPIPIDTTVSMKMEAVEVNDGVVGIDPKFGETMFGYSFLGRTTEGLPGSFTFSMNCAPAAFILGESNAISGGTWTLPVYMRPFRSLSNVYVGSLYGGIVDGKMGWAKDGTADIFMSFNVDGGTDTFAGSRGQGTFQGTIKVDENGEKTISGVLTITYGSVVTLK